MRLLEEWEQHLIFEVGEQIVCIPLDNPRACFTADSLRHARALILEYSKISYESAMLS